jgi:hypothetical protein
MYLEYRMIASIKYIVSIFELLDWNLFNVMIKSFRRSIYFWQQVFHQF